MLSHPWLVMVWKWWKLGMNNSTVWILTANSEQNDWDFLSHFQTLYLYEVIRVKILNHCFIFSLSNKSAESVVWWWNGYALRKYYRKNQSAELADIGFFCSNQHHHHFSLVYCYDELKSGIIALVSTKAHSVWKSLKLSHLLNFTSEGSIVS